MVCGGKRGGSVLAPTVLTGSKETQKVNCEEIFAPVVTVEAYDDFDEAIARVNRSSYGLQAGVFTRDIDRLLHAYEELEVGGVIAGDVPSFRVDQMPYGGVKDSGVGTRRDSLCDGGDDRAQVAGDSVVIEKRTGETARLRPRFCFGLEAENS